MEKRHNTLGLSVAPAISINSDILIDIRRDKEYCVNILIIRQQKGRRMSRHLHYCFGAVSDIFPLFLSFFIPGHDSR